MQPVWLYAWIPKPPTFQRNFYSLTFRISSRGLPAAIPNDFTSFNAIGLYNPSDVTGLFDSRS